MSDFLSSGLAAMVSITCTHPMDVVKTKLQASNATMKNTAPVYRGVAKTLYDIASSEGFRGMYRGLGAAYCLQFVVTSTRFGTYAWAKQALADGDKRHTPTYAQSVALAIGAGVLGALAGNPFYLLKTQYQAMSSVSEKNLSSRQHGSLINAFRSIYWEGGSVLGYWRGLGAFLPRVVVYSAVQLSTYDKVTQYLLAWGSTPGVKTQLLSSAITSVFAVGAMTPFDFVAVRLMNQGVDSRGRPLLYSGSMDCVKKVVREEGVRGLYRGGLANYIRMGPYTILTFLVYEKLRLLL